MKAAGRLNFKSGERLKSRLIFDRIMADGLITRQGPVRMHYLFLNNDILKPGIYAQAAFAVPKRTFRRAVDRNLLKRRMREAYRLAKPPFLAQLERHGIHCAILFVYQGREKEPFRRLHEVISSLIFRILSNAGKPD